MSTIKEKKEFFTSLNTQGEEINFDKNRQGGLEGSRLFKNGNYPDESAFEKLFSSIIFGLNKEDRAKSTLENTQTNDLGVSKVIGGHTTIATDNEAKSFDNGDEALYTRAVRPSQLPEVVDGLVQEITIEDKTFNGVILSNSVNQTSLRNVYQDRLSGTFLVYLKSLIEDAIVPVGTISQYYGTKQGLLNSNKPWLFLSENFNITISREIISGGTYFGDKYENLYFLLGRAKGLSENIIQSNWNTNVFEVLFKIDPVNIQSQIDANYIIKY